jgi:hypothetical protein
MELRITDEPLERIAAALERIAWALEAINLKLPMPPIPPTPGATPPPTTYPMQGWQCQVCFSWVLPGVSHACVGRNIC